MLGGLTVDVGLRSISVPSWQAGGCPCCCPGSSVRHSPWEVLNGKCLSQMAVTLVKSPAAESCCWLVTMPSPITPGHPINSAMSSVWTYIWIYTLIKKKKKASWREYINSNRFLFMSPGYKGISSLSLGRESGLSNPVRNLRGSKHTGKAGLLSLFFYCCIQIPGTVLLWVLQCIFRGGWEEHMIIMVLKTLI